MPRESYRFKGEGQGVPVAFRAWARLRACLGQSAIAPAPRQRVLTAACWVGLKKWEGNQDIAKQWNCRADGNPTLPFRAGERMADLHRKDIRSDKFHQAL